MSFIWPEMLWFLLLIPAFIGIYLAWQRRRRRLADRYGKFGFSGEPSGLNPGMQRHIPPAVFLFGISLLVVSMARPQAVFNVPKIQGTVILAFDVSGSMAAEDLQPNRMEAAKAAARAFIAQQPAGIQIGIVAFSESGFAIQPPTGDQDTLLAAIDRLTPQMGTSLTQGIIASINTIAVAAGEPPPVSDILSDTATPVPVPISRDIYQSAAVVMLTDGENTAPPDPILAAQNAANLGLRIFTVGIGSPAGTSLTVNGFTVHTRLDEDALKRISEITGGTYSNAENENDLIAIYENIGKHWVIQPEDMEVTSVFAGASLLVFLIGGIFSLLWLNRLP